MRRVVPVIFLFAFCYFSSALIAGDPPAKEPAVGALIEQLKEKDSDRICAAARALGQIAPKEGTISALKELLGHREGRVRWTAAEALWKLEHNAAALEPVYTELLLASDAEVRAASAWRLGRLRDPARSTVLVLAGALRDESLEVRVQAGQALANLGADAKAALPALLRRLAIKSSMSLGMAKDGKVFEDRRLCRHSLNWPTSQFRY